jgi:hypothetical protein
MVDREPSAGIATGKIARIHDGVSCKPNEKRQSLLPASRE